MEHYSIDPNSQIKFSLNRLSEAITKFEKAIKKQNNCSCDVLNEGIKEIEKQKQAISEINRILEIKKGLLKSLK